MKNHSVCRRTYKENHQQINLTLKVTQVHTLAVQTAVVMSTVVCTVVCTDGCTWRILLLLRAEGI